MSLVVVVGDAVTTTTLALAATWPGPDEVRVLEADPRGGSLAAWLDVPSTPSLATIVAGTTTTAEEMLGSFDAAARRARSGIRFVSAPARARAAHRAVEEAANTLLPVLAAQTSTVLVDAGALRAYEPLPAACQLATIAVVAHRQAPASAAAEAVRLERLVEVVEQLAHSGVTTCVATIGAAPFDPGDIADFVDTSLPDATVSHLVLADDALSAATLAGRTGVSARRFTRLPLMRDAASAASWLSDAVRDATRARHDVSGGSR